MAAAPFLSPTLRVNTFEFSCKMSFLLLDPLKTPGPSTIPHLLGRFVLDRSDPMIGGYAPEDPSGVVERFIDDELIASNGELFVQRLSSTKITAVVRKAIQVAVRHEASSNGDTTIDSVKIIRLRMKQAREAFDALIDADTIRAQVQQLMKRAKTSRAWMITGILIGQDATIETNAESKKIKGVSAALEVPAEVAAAAPALAPLAGSKVGEVAVERRHEAGSKAGRPFESVGRSLLKLGSTGLGKRKKTTWMLMISPWYFRRNQSHPRMLEGLYLIAEIKSKYSLFKLKGKLIKEGFKIWGLGCVGGYYYDWLLHSPVEGAEGCNRRRLISFTRDANGTPIMLSVTFQVLVILLKRLRHPYPHSKWLVFLDNLFLNLNVAQTLLALNIGIMSTTRKSLKGLPEKLIALKELKQPLIYGGYKAIVKENILCFAWQDNNVVLGLTTAFSLHKVGDFVIRDRRRPGDASTNARIALLVFGEDWIKPLPIPLAIDAYNHGMNTVDNANQIRANFSAQLRFERRNWRPLA
ncbi:hypothetical protein CLAIMM_04254 [Cladophialophora immunda]|nr:hypothetical protein CLAIMM_04254 [Cladophialophora immunda]